MTSISIRLSPGVNPEMNHTRGEVNLIGTLDLGPKEKTDPPVILAGETGEITKVVVEGLIEEPNPNIHVDVARANVAIAYERAGRFLQ